MTNKEFGQEQEWANGQTDGPSANSCQPDASAQNIASDLDRPLSDPRGTVENFDGIDSGDGGGFWPGDPGPGNPPIDPGPGHPPLDPGPGHLQGWMTMRQGTAANFDSLHAADASPKEEEDPGPGRSEY